MYNNKSIFGFTLTILTLPMYHKKKKKHLFFRTLGSNIVTVVEIYILGTKLNNNLL